MYQKINDELKKAMLAKDEKRTSVLRMMKSKIMAVNARGDLEDREILKILSTYAKQLKDEIKGAQDAGRQETIAAAEAELAIVEEFLPKAMSDEETTEVVKNVLKEVGATSMKDMGKVMKELLAKHPTIDGKKANEIIRQSL